MTTKTTAAVLIISALWQMPARAQQLLAVEVNRYNIQHNQNTDNVFLTSTVTYGPLPLFRSLYYDIRYRTVDILLDVIWKDNTGGTILHGGDGFGALNSWFGLRTDYIGPFGGREPFDLFAGKADFTNTLGNIRLPCSEGRVCPADYHDWTWGSTSGNPEGPEQLIVAEASMQTALPEGFEMVTETRATIVNVVRSPTDPSDLDAAIEEPAYEFVSAFEESLGSFSYTYTVRNLTDQEIQFDIPELELMGTLGAAEEFVTSTVSPQGPAFLRTAPTVLVGPFGEFVTARFDALVPVPEAPCFALMLMAFALITGNRSLIGPQLRPNI